jgi:hypothetical protein
MTAEHRLAQAVQTLQAHVNSSPAGVVDRTDAPADLNGLVRFVERRNLVSARVPSHFTRSLYFYNKETKQNLFRLHDVLTHFNIFYELANLKQIFSYISKKIKIQRQTWLELVRSVWFGLVWFG